MKSVRLPFLALLLVSAPLYSAPSRDLWTEDLPIRKLITWFRLNYQSGDEVVYTVRGGNEFRFALPKDN